MSEPMVEEPTAPVPLWRYTITLVDQPRADGLLNNNEVVVEAVGYDEDGPWTIFDDTFGTVLTRRTDTILEVRRSTEPVSHQRADQV